MRISRGVLTGALVIASVAGRTAAAQIEVPVNGTSFGCFGTLAACIGSNGFVNLASTPIGAFGGALNFAGTSFGNNTFTIGNQLSVGNFGTLTYDAGAAGAFSVNNLQLNVRFTFTTPVGSTGFAYGSTFINGAANGTRRNLRYSGFTTNTIDYAGVTPGVGDIFGTIGVTVGGGNIGTSPATLQGVVTTTASSVVPEPATVGLMAFGLGALGLVGVRRRTQV